MDNIQKLQAGKPCVAGKISVLPIERLFIHFEKGTAGYWLAAQKEPHAIIICDSHNVRAFNLQAKEMSLEHLTQTIPGLDVILASLAQ